MADCDVVVVVDVVVVDVVVVDFVVVVDIDCFVDVVVVDFVSTTAVVDKAAGNHSCFTVVMTNWFWAQQQNRNYRVSVGVACVRGF